MIRLDPCTLELLLLSLGLSLEDKLVLQLLALVIPVELDYFLHWDERFGWRLLLWLRVDVVVPDWST